MKVKQPWEMTREEFAITNKVKKDSMEEARNATAPIGSFEHLGEKFVSRIKNAYSFINQKGRVFNFDIIKTERQPKFMDTPEITRYLAVSPNGETPLAGIVYNHRLGQLVAASNLEGKIGIIQRLMREAEKDGLNIDVAQPMSKQGSNSWHRYIIEKVLSEGKPVPAEVLKDYPELKNISKTITGKADDNIEGMYVLIVGKKYPVESYKDASERYRGAINYAGIGASQIPKELVEPKIYKNGEYIGYISYNGRVWKGDPANWKTSKILYDPTKQVIKKKEQSKPKKMKRRAAGRKPSISVSGSK